MQFHHACCDGIGALRFIGHVLAAYGLRTAPADRRPTLQPCDPASLLRRGQFLAAPARKDSRARAICNSLRDGARWLGRRPTPLCPGAPLRGRAPTRPFLEMHRHPFNLSAAGRIGRAGTRQGVTVNDLLLRDLLQTLREWNARQAPGSADRCLRIAMPVKLKTADDQRMPAANGLSYTFLTRRESQCADAGDLLQGIHGETDPATRCRRGLLFLRGFRLLERIPGAVPC